MYIKQKKILLIKLGALGDFVLMTGLMKNIRRLHPTDAITLMTSASLVSLGKESDYFDSVAIDTRPSWQLQKWYHTLKNILIDGHFDLIYDFQISRRTLRKYLPVVRFFSKKDFDWVCIGNDSLTYHHFTKGGKIGWGKETISIKPFKNEKGNLSFCKGTGKFFHLLPKDYVLLIPGCSVGHPYKRWPAESYALLAQKLAKNKIYSVVLGTKDEAQAIETICRDNPYAVSFMDKSSLTDIPVIAKRARVIVGNDTGPTHMASLVEKPTVVLFCQKTSRSANLFDNVQNIIQEDIADISVDCVFDCISPFFKDTKK